MDAITLLMVKRNPIVLDALFQILQLLMEKYPPGFEYESVYQVTKYVLENTPQVSPCYGDMITAYTGIIYESCLVPKIYRSRPLLQIDPSIRNGSLSKVEIFHRFVQPFLKRNQALNGQRTDYVQQLLKQGFPRIKIDPNPPVMVQGRPSFTSSSSSGNTTLDPFSIDSPATTPDSNESYLSKFLSSFRRSGMDILFPQLIHDKLLLLIFVSTNVLGPLTHRELIEIINQMKQSGMLAKDFQSVSKTKMRGVVTLCRNAHGLVVVGKGEGDSDSMKLSISEELTDFEKFRLLHDDFIVNCLQQRALHLPEAVKADILWPKEDIRLADKGTISILQQTQQQLQALFTTEKDRFLHILKQMPPMASPTSSSSSKPEEMLDSSRLTMGGGNQRVQGDHRGTGAFLSTYSTTHIHSEGSYHRKEPFASYHSTYSDPYSAKNYYSRDSGRPASYSDYPMKPEEPSSGPGEYYSLFPTWRK